MREQRIRDQVLDKNGMSLTKMFTNDSGNDEIKFTIKDINLTRIGSMKSPIVMRTGAGNGIKINRINNFIIRCLI